MYVLHIAKDISVQCRAVLSLVYNVNVVTFFFPFGRQEKKEEIWLRIMTKAPTPTEKNPKINMTTQKCYQNYDCTTIADRLRTVSWINNSNLTGAVKPVYGHPAFPLTTRYNFCSVSSFGILNLQSWRSNISLFISNASQMDREMLHWKRCIHRKSQQKVLFPFSVELSYLDFIMWT